MKKRILAIFLSALLVTNISACNYVSNDSPEEEPNELSINESDDTEDLYINRTQSQSNRNEEINQPVETFLNMENNQPQRGSEMMISEYQRIIGCYVTTKSSNNVQQLMSEDESKIKVEHKGYGSNLFYITTVQDGVEYKTNISLFEGIRTPDIYCGFTSEHNGYVIIFHMEGYSVSPMDDIELACILKTVDGGKTWDKTEYSDFRVSNGREYISAACFFTGDVGFFTARYTNSDHFGPRTYWTVNGGETWTCMPRLDVPNVLEPLGIEGDFSSEVSDVSIVNGIYILTVRICHGYSVVLDGETINDIYIQYLSTDLVNWSLIQ